LTKSAPVLFGFVGFVGGGKSLCTNPDTSTRAAIILALRRGMKTPGSIASAAKLGATDTYQELDRMMSDGILSMQTNGALCLVVAPDPEAIQ
jgi:hypothetical protein